MSDDRARDATPAATTDASTPATSDAGGLAHGQGGVRGLLRLADGGRDGVGSALEAPDALRAGLADAAAKASPADADADHEGDAADEMRGADIEDAVGAVPDLHEDASRAAAEAVLGAIVAHERARALAQGYLARPPTWIQGAATVNLAEFPQHEDPSTRSEHELQTLEWMLAERARHAAAQADEAGPGAGDGRGNGDGRGGRTAAVDPDELGALQLLLPSTWLPLLREHRDTLLAGGVGLLLLSWLVSWQAGRRRTRRRLTRSSSHRRHHHRQPPSAPPETAVRPDPPPKRSKHRRRHAAHDGQSVLAVSQDRRRSGGGGSHRR